MKTDNQGCSKRVKLSLSTPPRPDPTTFFNALNLKRRPASVSINKLPEPYYATPFLSMPENNSLFPFTLPKNPNFMISYEKMSLANKAEAKVVIRHLGGDIVSDGDNVFDPDCVALIAERLVGNEKVVCGIAAGIFILKMSYIKKSREAGRLLQVCLATVFVTLKTSLHFIFQPRFVP